MAKPRVFVSSTYYDLKHIRSSLDLFIDSLGYESILSEKGDIAYSPDAPLDASCYREVTTADIFVLIIGGRYGSQASGDEIKSDKKFNERYESITKKEYETAADTPTYILVEASVYAEYRTYLQNKDNDDIKYAHVDSVNIFRLIEEILAKPRNNPIHTFERFSDIESWLRDQWAGSFRELLKKTSGQKQLATLSAQIDDLRAVNTTLKRYLEALMSGASKEDSTKLIEKEEKRLEERERRDALRDNNFVAYLLDFHKLDLDDVIKAIVESKSFDEFCKKIGELTNSKVIAKDVQSILVKHEDARAYLNKARKLMSMPLFKKAPSNVDK